MRVAAGNLGQTVVVQDLIPGLTGLAPSDHHVVMAKAGELAALLFF